MRDAKKSTTPNDWLLQKTEKEETFVKVGKMVVLFSKKFKKEAEKYGFMSYSMDEDFNGKLLQIIHDLSEKN